MTDGQAELFTLATPDKRRGPRLTASEAATLYRSGKSVCEIARDPKITRQGVENHIRNAGLGGNVWCPIHRTHEALRLEDGQVWGGGI